MEEYKNYWKNYANFNDRTSTRGFWIAFLIYVAINIILSIILVAGGLSIAALIQGGGFSSMLGGFGMLIYIIMIIWDLANIVPMLAITIRRLHDTGKPWVYILFSLIPCVGWIIMIVFLVKNTDPQQFGNQPQV